MKQLELIKQYCSIYGVDMPTNGLNGTNVFVGIDSFGARVFTYTPNKLLGQVLSGIMKRGVVFHIYNGSVRPIEWKNWKQFWGKWFTPKVKYRKELLDKCTEKMPEPNAFEQGVTKRPTKRRYRMGGSVTVVSNHNLNLMGRAIQTEKF